MIDMPKQNITKVWRWGQSAEGSTVISGDTQIFFYHSVGQFEVSSRTKAQFNPFVCFYRTLTSDGKQTQGHS